MTDQTLEDVADDLDRATDLETERALDVLEGARADLEALSDDPDVDEEERADLERRLDQRIREVRNRGDYDGGGGSGAAMNPDEEDAP